MVSSFPVARSPGVLRDAHGVLVLEFQRPDDPLDVQMELAELILSRDEVPDVSQNSRYNHYHSV